jgi:hypothetical protein
MTTIQGLDDRARQRYWHSNITSPAMWAMTAQHLARAAEILWKRFDRAQAFFTKFSAQKQTKPRKLKSAGDMMLSAVAFMLMGFAIENLLKGLWVKRMAVEQPFVGNDPRIPKVMKHHDLNELAKEARFIVSPDREDLLDRLKVELIWGGRYSHPRRPGDFFPAIPGRPGHSKARYFQPGDWDPIVALYNELCLMLRPKAAKRRRKSGKHSPRA